MCHLITNTIRVMRRPSRIKAPIQMFKPKQSLIEFILGRIGKFFRFGNFSESKGECKEIPPLRPLRWHAINLRRPRRRKLPTITSFRNIMRSIDRLIGRSCHLHIKFASIKRSIWILYIFSERFCNEKEIDLVSFALPSPTIDSKSVHSNIFKPQLITIGVCCLPLHLVRWGRSDWWWWGNGWCDCCTAGWNKAEDCLLVRWRRRWIVGIE